MKKILIHGLSLINNNLFNEISRDDCNRPFIILKNELFKRGYDLQTSDKCILNDDVRYIFFFDVPSFRRYKSFRGYLLLLYSFFLNKPITRDLYKECLKKKYQNKMILFLWEASAICPQNCEIKHHAMFSKIFTWNDDLINYNKYQKIYIPNSVLTFNFPYTTFNKKKLLVNISMNKFSNHPNELYGERRKLIKYFEFTQKDNFDLYGIGWNKKNGKILFSKNYSSYKGEISNKGSVLSQYKFCICFENIYGENGYITEKILDCLKYGCIPIYFGAPNVKEYIDSGIFLDYREFKSLDSLNRYISNFGEIEYIKFKNRLECFLKSDKYHRFSPEYFANTIINSLEI